MTRFRKSASLGERLKKLRGDKTSLREAADKAGIHFSYLARLEQGKITNLSLKIALDLCRAYATTIEELTAGLTL